MRTWRWMRTRCVTASALLATVGCASAQEDYGSQITTSATPDNQPVSTFRDVLSPYGSWMQLPDVGWVWSPDPAIVGANFEPYVTGGQWTYSDWGWTFETDWSWGWAPFHYGRWYLAPSAGWVWWPDDEWAPSWVDWRWGDGFVGWQPLGPPGVQAGLSWTFVGVTDLERPHLNEYVVPRARMPELLEQTQLVGTRVPARHGQWSTGPAPDQVARLTGHPVPRSKVTAPPTGHPPVTGTPPEVPRSARSTPVQERPRTNVPPRPPPQSKPPPRPPVQPPEQPPQEAKPATDARQGEEEAPWPEEPVHTVPRPKASEPPEPPSTEPPPPTEAPRPPQAPHPTEAPHPHPAEPSPHHGR